MTDKIIDFTERNEEKNKTFFEKNIADAAKFCENAGTPAIMIYQDENGNPLFMANYSNMDDAYIALIERCKNHIVNYGIYPDDEDD